MSTLLTKQCYEVLYQVWCQPTRCLDTHVMSSNQMPWYSYTNQSEVSIQLNYTNLQRAYIVTSLGGSIHVLRSYLTSALFTAATTGEWTCFTVYLVTSHGAAIVGNVWHLLHLTRQLWLLYASITRSFHWAVYNNKISSSQFNFGSLKTVVTYCSLYQP